MSSAQRAALRVPMARVVGSTVSQRLATRTSSFGQTSPAAAATGGTAQTNAAGNTVGSWSESSNLVDIRTTSGTIDLIFATGPQEDQMTIYYPPRGQPGSRQIHDTGMLATPNNGKDLAQGASIKVSFGPGTGTVVEIVVNEGATDNRGTIWTYTGTGTGVNGQKVTINGSMSGGTTTGTISAPARTVAPVLIPRGYTRVGLR